MSNHQSARWDYRRAAFAALLLLKRRNDKFLVFDGGLSGGTVMIRQGKGRRDRYIPLGERACYWVEWYCDRIRPSLAVREDEWTLFLTDYGEPFGKGRLSDLVKRYMERAGIREGA